MAQREATIWSPQAGFQRDFVSSNVDFLVGGAAMGCGKSFAALLMAAPHLEDPNFRMVYIRRNIGDLKVGGGGTDEAQRIYGSFCTLKISDSPRLTHPSGAFVDFTHMSDQTPDKVLERIKGWQYSCIYVDEGTGFEWSTIRLLLSRNRSQARWSGKFRVTCNPKRNHWLRVWVDWYVDADGYPIPERNGVVRYFYVAGDNIEDVVFGDTREEVYFRCRDKIDTVLRAMNQAEAVYTYRDVVKSTTFLASRLSENKALLANDPSYMGSVASMGEKQAQANLLGCWNVSEDDDDAPVRRARAAAWAESEPAITDDEWITVDLADTGTNNCLMLYWRGLHICDYQILERSTPRMNANALRLFAQSHKVGEAHIVYDAQRAAYMLDEFPSAQPFLSFKPAKGVQKLQYERLKDECFGRMCDCINSGTLTCDASVARARYHQQTRRDCTFTDEFVRECAAVRFTTSASGKRKLLSKKDLNRPLGSGASMDLLDCMAQRFLPLLRLEPGSELVTETQVIVAQRGDFDIYDDSSWF